MDSALRLLKPQLRQLLQRHFIEGDSVRAIASATGVLQHQLRKSIRNAINLLATCRAGRSAAAQILPAINSITMERPAASAEH